MDLIGQLSAVEGVEVKEAYYLSWGYHLTIQAADKNLCTLIELLDKEKVH